MTVRVNKQPFNIREKLSEVERPIGVKGNELMRAETAQDARDLVSAGRKNLIINGDMRICQRYGFNNPQTADNSNSYYLDRFAIRENTGGAFQVRQSTPGWPFEAAMQINVTTADTSISSAEYARIQYYVEGNDPRAVDWGKAESKDHLTLSFWVKSNAPGDYHVSIENSNNNYFPIMIKKYTIEQSGVWQKVVVTFPPPGEYNFHRGTGIGLRITWSLAIGSSFHATTEDSWFSSSYRMSTSTQRNFMDTAGNDFYLTGVQLEKGRNATDFEHRPYAEELALCQRYCQYFEGRVAIGNWNGGTGALVVRYLSPPMRATPSIHSYTAGRCLVEAVAWYTVGSVAIQSETRNTSAVFQLSGVANSGQSVNANAMWGNGASVVLQAEL